MNIYLIGYRCTGKTSVGNLLAHRLGMEFADTDRLLEQRAGMHISNYVSRYGWESFRDLETEIIRDLSRQDGLVAATGGGVVLREKNIEYMKDTGLLVWLKAGPDTILSRMQGDENTRDQRPALSGDPLVQEVYETLKQRTPLYERAAQIQVSTDEADIETVCETLIEKTMKPPGR